jgi:hypothetical protein
MPKRKSSLLFSAKKKGGGFKAKADFGPAEIKCPAKWCGGSVAKKEV